MTDETKLRSRPVCRETGKPASSASSPSPTSSSSPSPPCSSRKSLSSTSTPTSLPQLTHTHPGGGDDNSTVASQVPRLVLPLPHVETAKPATMVHPNRADLAKFILVSLPQILAISNGNYTSSAEKLVEILSNYGIKVIASDFDRTMITKHSGGCTDINNDKEGILNSLSKQFDAFAAAANKRNITVCVVTFSDEISVQDHRSRIAGGKLVDAVMKKSGASFVVSKVYGFYPVNWIQPEAYESLNLRSPMPDGKSYHLSQVCKDWGVSPRDVVLVDDDIYNCQSARDEGYLSIHVKGRSGFEFEQLTAV